ncbi:MAG: hypothetical protein RR515_05590 [Clostridium sp.]
MIDQDFKSLLNSFLEVTIKASSILENDMENTLDDVEVLLTKREEIISSINSLDYSTKEFNAIAVEIGLLKEEQKLLGLFQRRKIEIKSEIDQERSHIVNIKKQRIVNNKYINNNPIDPVFLSRKY